MGGFRNWRLCVQKFLIVNLLLITGCGSGSTPVQTSSSTPANSPTPVQATIVTVAVTPSLAGVRHGDTLNFSAGVSGPTNTNVTWRVEEGATGGAISSKGVYSAPVAVGVYHIIATSQADPSKSATATVTVTESGFSPTGALSSARLLQTATLLPSGKVLIVGGGEGPDLIDGYWVVDQAELFDPSTQSFSQAGQEGRDYHSATLLQNGDVLIAGGETDWSASNAYGYPMASDAATAEIYQSSSGQFVPTGRMLTAREGHQATLLNDGKVLITGGVYALPSDPWWSPLAACEIFDPSTSTFAAIGPMNSPRYGHTATLLQNGKVLITGGGFPYASNTAELFDPATGAFQATGSMSVARNGHTATLLLNGKVLIAGGSGIGSVAAEIYDPNTGLFSPTGNMNVQRGWHTATLLSDGRVLIAAGYTIHEGSADTTEIYDPATGSFTIGPSLEQSRFSHTATSLPGGQVLVVGGASSADGISTSALTSAEIYH